MARKWLRELAWCIQLQQPFCKFLTLRFWNAEAETCFTYFALFDKRLGHDDGFTVSTTLDEGVAAESEDNWNSFAIFFRHGLIFRICSISAHCPALR